MARLWIWIVVLLAWTVVRAQQELVSVRRLTLRLDYQEEFVAYLNGTEILRVGVAGQSSRGYDFFRSSLERERSGCNGLMIRCL